MLAEAQRSIISTRYNEALSRAFLSRARNAPSQVRFEVGDQVMYWRGNNKRKSQRSMRWLGPGIVIGHEGRANVWISHLRSQCCQILCMHQCAIHECVGAQMFWNTQRHRLFHHPLCLRKMCLQPHHHGLHLCQSPVKRRRFHNLLHLTLMCNLSFHRQRPWQMMTPCRFLTLIIHHHGSHRNQRHRGFLPSNTHQ